MSPTKPLRFQFLRDLWQQIWEDDALNLAAQLAYYFLFSVFPLLFFLVALTAYLPLQDALQRLLARLQDLMTTESFALIKTQVHTWLSNPKPHFLSLGIFFSLWIGSRGFNALREALNKAYQVKETRGYIKQQLLAIGAMIWTTVLGLIGAAAILLGSKLGIKLALLVHLPPKLFTWLRWPISAVILIFFVDICYWTLPNTKHRLSALSRGALTGTGLALASTWGFSKYVEHFGKYNHFYGALGSVIVLLTWFYLLGLSLILGGQINATYTRRKNAAPTPVYSADG